MANRKIDRGWSEMTVTQEKMAVPITGHNYCLCRYKHELFQVVTDHSIVCGPWEATSDSVLGHLCGVDISSQRDHLQMALKSVT